MGTGIIPPEGNAPPESLLTRGPHEFVEDQVELTPDATALIMGAERLSYMELNAGANRLAQHLREQGAKIGTLVGVHLDRGFDSVISLLAIFKLGGIYVPLDPKFPKERLEFMAEDSGISFLLAHSSRWETMPRTSARVILLDREAAEIAKAPGQNQALARDPEALLYIIYTSGSTGKPKGVMIPRRGLVNFLLAMLQQPGIYPNDVLLAVSPTSFDISLLEFLLPLMRGATVAIATVEQAGDGRALDELIKQHDATVLQATPATWRMLLEIGWEGKPDLRILCGAEALAPDLARQLLPRCRELWNLYGPTETSVWCSTDHVVSAEQISLGTPIANTYFRVLDENRKPVAAGEPGELWIGGEGMAHGYLNRAELSAERFVADARFARTSPDGCLYRTGDEVRYRADGTLEFLGRLDHQVKLNGFRIELGEIECSLTNIEGVRQSVVMLREDTPGDKKLVAYYTGRKALSSSALNEALKKTLPDYMTPSLFVHMERFPITPNGKLDRKALPKPGNKRPVLTQDYIAPRTATEKQLALLWQELLEIEEIGIDDSFFDLGGNSVKAVRMVRQYHVRFGREIPVVKVFQHSTIANLARLLDGSEETTDFLKAGGHGASLLSCSMPVPEPSRSGKRDAIAVIGMTGRFPGASNVDQLWHNLRNSVESISTFTPEELGPGIEEWLRNDPNYVRARGLIEGAELFDASFFGIGPLEAKVMDPQQRVFLELAHHALENAGYDPERYPGRIGVFAGTGDNHYYPTNLLTQPDLMAMAGRLAVEYGNEKDYIALRAAYLLDLRGPAISAATACSTTLLTIDLACRALQNRECDMALSGGVDIMVPQKSGTLYQEGGTFTKDGHCRPFDADATGTMFCDGAGVVVLKRYADAVADGDTIYALIIGSGTNNNGARPASFLAPSMDGQAEAIALAQADAGVPVESIGYVEAHGTATPVGDPIEFEALRKVFEHKTSKKQFCYLGSIKGNIGHPTNAAGVVGLMKTALVLDREEIPPTLHFKKPNPAIDFANSPFVMADKLIPFPRGTDARRAAVSSFGFGGTNVHVILEEAPKPRPSSESRPRQLVLLSAKTEKALAAYSAEFERHFAASAPGTFADAAFTLQTGRKQMAYRRFVVAADPTEAAELLAHPHPMRSGSKRCELRNPPVTFLFGGQGTQYVNMGLNLYRDEPLFRAIVDDCCEQLKPHLGLDLRTMLFPPAGDEKAAQISLQNTLFTQPSIFVIEYALARFWQSLGVEPAMMAGHSIGEFVAATLAGVWEPEDVLGIVALRGRLMQNLPRGSMLAVNASADSIAKILPITLQIASNNAPTLCVVSGPEADIQDFQAQIEAKSIVCRHLHTSHAFHSAMMDPIVEPLREAIAKLTLRKPAKPFVSSVKGRPITDEEATDPSYWAGHARATVEFAKALHYLKKQGYDLFLECGPRSTMCSLARHQFTPERPCMAIPTLGETAENDTEWQTFLFALGTLWQNGVPISWDAFYTHEDRRRIPLPTYPFERQRFWVDPAVPVRNAQNQNSGATGIGSSIALPTELTAAADSHATSAPQALPASRKDRIRAVVMTLLAEISGIEASQIDSTAMFMEQGFDSLLLTQVALAIRKEFSAKVSFSQLMNQFPNVDLLVEHLDATISAAAAASTHTGNANGPEIPAVESASADNANTAGDPTQGAQAKTIADLAALLEEAGIGVPASLAAGVAQARSALTAGTPESMEARQSSRTIAPLEARTTIPQRGIFASSSLSKNLSISYNESTTVRFTGSISAEKMKRALERIVERHDALRASFDEAGRLMRINPRLSVELPVADLTTVTPSASPEEQEERLRKLIADEVRVPFRLPAGPLFRFKMAVLGADRTAVIITAHHVVCDGWSLDVLIHDLCAYYSEELSGATVPMPPAESFAEYCNNATDRELSDEFRHDGEYWRTRFSSGFPALVLPTDRPRSARREFRSHRLDYSVPGSVIQGLRLVAAKQGCSLFATLLSSLAVLFARISKQRHFVLALPIAEQPVAGQLGLVGQCVNLVPFELDFRNGETMNALLKRVQSDLAIAQDHAVFTMIGLLPELRPVTPVLGLSPISSGFTHIKKFKPGDLPQSGFTVDYEFNPKSSESFELYMSAVESEESIEFHCSFDVKLFDDTTVREWLGWLGSILESVSTDSSRDALELAGMDKADPSSASKAMYVLTTGGEPLEVPTNDEPAETAAMNEQELAEALLPLWRRVLATRSITLDDDFFEAGGNSVAAAQLFAMIQRELGYSAPLSTLYDATTPRTLAGMLWRGMSEHDWKPLVAINRNGNRTPLFLAHAAEGNILLYRSLAAHLGADQPVYGLQSAGLDGRTKIDADFEHVASRYVDEIRAIQPHGPYMLGGYCLGGTIAMEMARQLMEQGEKIGLVAHIENYNIRAMTWPLPLRDRLTNLLLNPYYHLENVFAAEGTAKIDFFMEKLRVELRRLKVSVRGGWDGIRYRLSPDGKRAAPQSKLADIYDEALDKYEIRPYPGELTLFLSNRHLKGFDIPLAGWGDVAQGGVRVFSFPFSPRGSLIEPYVRQLAEKMHECLDIAAERSKNSSETYATYA